MANEEQRKAFAAYMGRGNDSTASGGQPLPQYPGSVANPANAHLFNEAFWLCQHTFSQFPGLGVPPAAPTPPPAAGSSVISYPGFQGGYPAYGWSGHTGIPHRPPPLGQGQGQGQVQGQGQGQGQNQPVGGQQAQTQPGYAQMPLPPPPGYNGYANPGAPQSAITSFSADSGIMVPAPMPHPPGVINERTKDEKCKKHMSRYARATGYAREPVYVEIDNSERIGRRKERDEVYTSWRTDHLRPHVVRQGTSRANIGLRTIQRSPPRRRETIVREEVSSVGPGQPRYEGPWPPPDVVRMTPSRPPTELPVSDEVWPPPDVVRTYSYRKETSSRPAPRIIELSPSPPPRRSSTSGVRYRVHSEERRPRSPVRRSASHIRLRSQPRPYKTVVTERRAYYESDNSSANGAGEEPADHGIPKPRDVTYETSYRRKTSQRDSQQSTKAEAGGHRVQFAPEESKAPPSSRRHDDPTQERYSRSESYHYVNRPASPPIDRMERLHIRHSSPSPERISEDIRVDRARRISPSPPARRYERVRVRYVSVSPTRRASPPAPRARLPRSPSPPPLPPQPERTVRSSYRHVSKVSITDRTRSLTPPLSRRHTPSEADVTDSEDEQESVIEVRSWKGIDENGKPATFVEERRKTHLIEQGSVGGSEFRPLFETVRPVVRPGSWRDV
ncbi:hypothetical protein E8E13_009182 [Curvularia kusanoi]|uniref:Uncharacterized protein n=1 Tax=Curvularia kusanoi TaxID=90978 RepID=A0A9P4W669_CURKU|nr:hypothetical protein E8E13_009182 [Curvularia kusanoi]